MHRFACTLALHKGVRIHVHSIQLGLSQNSLLNLAKFQAQDFEEIQKNKEDNPIKLMRIELSNSKWPFLRL